MIDKGFEKYVRSRFAMAEIESSQYMTFAEAERVFITLMEQVRADAWDEGYNEGALIGYSPMADNTPNPYRETNDA